MTSRGGGISFVEREWTRHVNDSATPAEAARAYAERGWRVIQLHGVQSGGRCTCTKGAQPTHRSQAGKHPVNSEWEKTPAPASPEDAAAPWRGWRSNNNIGVATGDPSGFWVLDIDPENGGLESAARLAEEHPGEFPPTIVNITGSGGYHYFFTMPDFPVGQARGELKAYPGLDVRGTGGQVVMPPSVSAKGPYRRAPHSADEIGPAPDWLLEMIRPKAAPTVSVTSADVPAVEDLDPAEAKRLQGYAEKARQGELARLQRMAEAATQDGSGYVGEPWNATTFEVACNLVELANSTWNGYTLEQAYSDLLRYAPTDSDFTSEDVNVRWESAVTKVGDNARPVPVPPQQSLVDAMMADARGRVQAPPEALAISRAALAGAVESAGKAPTQGKAPESMPAGPGAQDHPTAPAREVPRRTWDDIGNGKRFVDHFGGVARYLAEPEAWALYNGGRWNDVKANVVTGMAQRMIDELVPATEALAYSDIAPMPGPSDKEPPKSEREQFLAWLAKQRMASKVNACVAMAAGRPQVQASTLDFDARHHLLNASNGVVDLRTGELLPHDPTLLLRMQTSAYYDATAPCERWIAFLERVMPDEEQRRYLQSIVGYSLTGETISQAFFIHHGSGANGKSVFLQVLRAVLGDYGQSVPRETLLAKQNAEHPTSIARMQGKRFLEVSETAPGRRLDEEMVRNLSGGEQVTARYMGKDFYDYIPTGKVHYVTNHLPLMSDADATWRRLHLVRWSVRIPDDEQDRRLAQRLIDTELAGIFAWAVRGAMSWYEAGGTLEIPAIMKGDLAAYRQESDSFGEFLKERTVSAGPETATLLKELYAAYESWCFSSAGIKKPMSRQAFSAVMKERKYEQARLPGGIAYVGIVVAHTNAAPDWANFS